MDKSVLLAFVNLQFSKPANLRAEEQLLCFIILF